MTKETVGTGDPVHWPWALGLGALFGVLAGGIALFGDTWYNSTIPLGMMIASYIAVRKASGRGFWNGFIASLICVLLGITIYLGVRYEQILAPFPNKERIQLLYWALSILIPLQFILGVVVTWFFSRTKQRIEEEKAKEEAERKARIEQLRKTRANRPKKKFKKKNKR